MSQHYLAKNHILFLGAGASYNAGYPLTKDIFTALKKHCTTYPINNKLDQWKTFEEVINFLSEKLGCDFENQNSEIILTLPNLLNAAHDDFLDSAGKAYSQGNNQLIKKYEKIYDTKIWTKASNVSNLFRIFLDDYFIAKHSDDNNKTLPEYFVNMLNNVSCVITTNWDTLAERILFQANKWSPTDGYGFVRTMKKLDGIKPGEQKNYPLSETKVLKLHGSIGWHQASNNFYLRYDNYLQYLINHNIQDVAAPPGHGPHNDPVMLYPSYLKQLDNPILLSIWEEARKALESATSITIVGYSFPSADVAIRALLLPVRTNTATIKIVSTSADNSEENKRWRDYFKTSGKEPIFVKEEACRYFNR
jgi:SIR2-like protein